MFASLKNQLRLSFLNKVTCHQQKTICYYVSSWEYHLHIQGVGEGLDWSLVAFHILWSRAWIWTFQFLHIAFCLISPETKNSQFPVVHNG